MTEPTLINTESAITNVFMEQMFTEILENQETAAILGRHFSCANFASIPIIKQTFDVIRNGEFLNFSDCREKDIIQINREISKLTFKDGNQQELHLTTQTNKDLPRNGAFQIQTPGGEIIEFDGRPINQTQTTEQNVAFFNNLANRIEVNSQYLAKFCNILGKYFHQAGGIGSNVRQYFSKLDTHNGFQHAHFGIQGQPSTNKTTFDLTNLNQGIFIVEEYCELRRITKRTANFGEIEQWNNLEPINHENPIATFTFKYKVQLNNLNNQCTIEPFPLIMQIIDEDLMKNTYMPDLRSKQEPTSTGIIVNLITKLTTTAASLLAKVSELFNKVLNLFKRKKASIDTEKQDHHRSNLPVNDPLSIYRDPLADQSDSNNSSNDPFHMVTQEKVLFSGPNSSSNPNPSHSDQSNQNSNNNTKANSNNISNGSQLGR